MAFRKFIILGVILLAVNFELSSAMAGDPTLSSSDRKLTKIEYLKNKIPVVFRQTAGSDIVHIDVTFDAGTSLLPSSTKTINLLTFDSMPYATKKYSKDQIYALTEKYSLGVECKGGVEISQCQVDTVDDYLPQALDLLLSVVTEPKFNSEDVDLAKKQRIAGFRQEAQNPEAHVNTLINTIFYEPNHPYRLLPDDGIKQTESFKPADLQHYHQSVLDASIISVTIAANKLSPATKKALEARLGALKAIPHSQGSSPKVVNAPIFDSKKSTIFEHRAIPTAYVRAKFNAPSVTSPDAAAAEVMFEILSEKLHEEVRTKRSLSYSVFASSIQYRQGIGMIGASTSKPKEALEAIAMVVKNLKDHGVTQEELDEYRNVFTTSYYLTMETHDQLSSALSGSQVYWHDAFKFYDLPAKLQAVTPADIQRMAKSILKDLRVAVIYDQEKFKDEWIEPLKAL